MKLAETGTGAAQEMLEIVISIRVDYAWRVDRFPNSIFERERVGLPPS